MRESGTGGGDRSDCAVGVERDELIIEKLAGADVNQFTAANCAARRGGLRESDEAKRQD